MLSSNVTVCIFAWNEAHRLNQCISNFQGLFKILVVDNMSSDATVAVAQAAGCDVITVKNDGYIETDKVMSPVAAACKTDYMLIASCSEFVPFELLKYYADCANNSSYDVVRAYRKSITAGVDFPFSGLPGPAGTAEIRFFKIGSVDFSKTQVHDRGNIIVPSNRVANISNESQLHFYQFRDYDCSKTEINHCRYDDLLGIQMYRNHEKFSLIKALALSMKAFISAYIKLGGYRFGFFGLIHSYYRFHMVLTTWFRLWEWERGYDRESVLRKNKTIRAEMEKELSQVIKQLREAGDLRLESEIHDVKQ